MTTLALVSAVLTISLFQTLSLIYFLPLRVSLPGSSMVFQVPCLPYCSIIQIGQEKLVFVDDTQRNRRTAYIFTECIW